MTASNTPQPDEHGRFRVRRKGDTQSVAWSTTEYDPEAMVVVSGPASDTYGNAWPVKPHRRHGTMVESSNTPAPDDGTENNNERNPT